jgi:hypothetical protein
MCKEFLVIPVNKVVDPKRIIRKKWRAKEERQSRPQHQSLRNKETNKFGHTVSQIENKFDSA